MVYRIAGMGKDRPSGPGTSGVVKEWRDRGRRDGGGVARVPSFGIPQSGNISNESLEKQYSVASFLILLNKNFFFLKNCRFIPFTKKEKQTKEQGHTLSLY